MSNRKYRRRKNKNWKKNKKKFDSPEEEAKYVAQLITFNRGYHPVTKFKFSFDYGKNQSQYLTKNQKIKDEYHRRKNEQ